MYFNPRFPHGERRHNRQRQKPVAAISTHASRTGSDFPDMTSVLAYEAFQPTLPARGATTPLLLAFTSSFNFNPRFPHGERQGRDRSFLDVYRFQPTLPARGATGMTDAAAVADGKISTHASRTGSDVYIWRYGRNLSAFQPTLPARGATAARFGDIVNYIISTHASRTGSD